MSAPIATAQARPSSAPAPALAGLSAFWKIASRKTTVSSPSRMTARKAIATSAVAEPLASAAPALARSEPERSRAWRRIHTTMNVTIPTAANPTTVSSPSCWRCGSASSSSSKATPTTTQIATAATTPIHIGRSASRRPSWRRNVSMIPTMSAASTPSRRPMMKVGSMLALTSR